MAKKKSISNLFGLSDFSSGLSPIAGVGIGAGATIAGQFAASKIAAVADKQGMIGTGVGLAATAAMFFSKKHKHAAMGSLLGTALAAGIPWLKAKAGLAGLGIPQINYLNGLGVHQLQMLNGGLGAHTLEPTRTPHGTIPGVAGLAQAGIQMGADSGQPPVSLLGPSTAQSRQVSLMGGPAISGLSSAFGATLFGSR